MTAGDASIGTSATSEASLASRLLRYENIAVALVLIGLFVLVSGEVAKGRFWAEEGRDFFAPFLKRHIGAEVVYLYHGQLQLWTNFTMIAAEVAGLQLAPVVTTWVSGAVIIVVSMVIWVMRARLRLDRIGAAVLIGFYWFIPSAAELWANSTNMQWHASFLAALVLAMPADGERVWLRRMVLAACALEGLPACVLAPGFLLSGAVERNRQRLIEGGVLTVVGMLQGTLIFMLGDTIGRSFGFDAIRFIQAFVAQTVWAPFLGGDFLNDALRGRLESETVAIFTYVGALLFLAPLAIGRDRVRTAVLLAASLVAAAVGYLGMLGGGAGDLFSGSIGGRYFFTPALLYVLTWLWAVQSRLPDDLRLSLIVRAGAALALVPVLVLHVTNSPWRRVFFHGPDWAQEFRDLRDKGDRKLDIWPNGWSLEAPPPADGQK